MFVEQWLDEELGDNRAEGVLSHFEECADGRWAADACTCIKRAFARLEEP